MGIRYYKPTTPGRRQASVSDFSDITDRKKKPEKTLLQPKPKKGGRNNQGFTCTRFRGGGHKRQYRIIDFKRKKDNVWATVLSIEYDPNRTARIALLQYEDGERIAAMVSHRKPIALLENDGVLVLGTSVLDAFDRLEVLESTAEALIDSRAIGAVQRMSDGTIDELVRAFLPNSGR